MENNKQLEFFKTKIREKLKSIENDIPSIRYKLWLASVDACDSYEELREMAELDMQLDMFEYTKREINPKIQRLSQEMEALRNKKGIEIEDNRQKYNHIKMDNSIKSEDGSEYTPGEMLEDMDNPEMDAAMAAILAARIAEEPIEETLRDNILDSVNEIYPSESDLDDLDDGAFDGLLADDTDGESDPFDDFSDVQTDITNALALEDNTTGGSEDTEDEQDIDDIDLGDFEDTSDEEDEGQDIDDIDLDDFSDSDFNDTFDNSDLGSMNEDESYEGSNNLEDPSDTSLDNDLEQFIDEDNADEIDLNNDDSDEEAFANFFEDESDETDESDEADESDITEIDGLDDFEDFEDLDESEGDEESDLDTDLEGFIDDTFDDSDDTDSDESDESDDLDSDLAGFIDDTFDDSDKSQIDAEDELEDINTLFSDDISDEDLESELGEDDTDTDNEDNSDIFSNISDEDDMFKAFGDDSENSDNLDESDETDSDDMFSDISGLDDFDSDGIIDDNDNFFANENEKKINKGSIAKTQAQVRRELKPNSIFINGSDRGQKTQDMFNSIGKIGGLFSKISKQAATKTRKVVTNQGRLIANSSMFMLNNDEYIEGF